MNRKFTPYIYIVIFYSLIQIGFSQEKKPILLKLLSTKENTQTVINNLNYQKIFDNEKSAKKEINTVINKLRNNGYYTIKLNNVIKEERKVFAYLDLGPKTKYVNLRVSIEDKKLLNQTPQKSKTDKIIIESNKLNSLLKNLTNKLRLKGNSFSKINLTNINIKNDTLFASLNIKHSFKRKIDSIIIKGYDEFPKSFITHYYNIKNKEPNNETLKLISLKTENLDFINEVKKPEILFSKDSTIVFFYLNKKKNNTIDGLINFSSKNSKITFKGFLDLNLNNTFNKGEKINIIWNSLGNQKQNFNASFSYPYIFQSKFSTKQTFNLYKQDSTFTNMMFNAEVNYSLNQSNKLKLIYRIESSTTNNNNLDIKEFQKNLLGLGYLYISNSKKPLTVDLAFLYGIKKTNQNQNQSQIEFNFTKEFKISKQFNFYLKNKSAKIFSDIIPNNELFREGGINSIRGFNNQSIFAKSFSFFNTEIRFRANSKSTLYTIQDLGIYNDRNKSYNLYSFGLGYILFRENNSINLSLSKGYSNSNFFENSQILSVKILTLF